MKASTAESIVAAYMPALLPKCRKMARDTTQDPEKVEHLAKLLARTTCKPIFQQVTK